MDIPARIEELTQQQAALMQRHQEDAMNIQRLAGAIAILREQLAEGEPDEVSPNGVAAAELEPVEAP
jgi:hypothetical protein